MGGNGGQCPSEPETVGQEDVGALHTQLLAVKLLPQHDIADERLDGGHQSIGSIPTGPAHVPAACLYKGLHQFVFTRIILLHPGILHTTLEIEDVVGILVQEEKILVQGIPDILLDGGLDVPVPLCVQVGIRHHIRFRFLRCSGLGR